MVFCVLLLFAGSAWSYFVTIGTTDVNVGVLDTLIASDTLPNSGEATELAWVEDETGNSDLVMDANMKMVKCPGFRPIRVACMQYS